MPVPQNFVKVLHACLTFRGPGHGSSSLTPCSPRNFMDQGALKSPAAARASGRSAGLNGHLTSSELKPSGSLPRYFHLRLEAPRPALAWCISPAVLDRAAPSPGLTPVSPTPPPAPSPPKPSLEPRPLISARCLCRPPGDHLVARGQRAAQLLERAGSSTCGSPSARPSSHREYPDPPLDGDALITSTAAVPAA